MIMKVLRVGIDGTGSENGMFHNFTEVSLTGQPATGALSDRSLCVIK